MKHNNKENTLKLSIKIKNKLFHQNYKDNCILRAFAEISSVGTKYVRHQILAA